MHCDETGRFSVKRATEGVEEIQAGTAYSLAEFSRRVGLRDWAVRAARRAGLRVIHKHGRAFVLGSDWLAYLAAECGKAISE
jgi:hypothetical protein